MSDIVFKFEIEIRNGNTTTTKYYSDGENFYNATNQQEVTTPSSPTLTFGTGNDKKKVYVSGITDTTTSVYITDYGYGYELAIGNDLAKFTVSNESSS